MRVYGKGTVFKVSWLEGVIGRYSRREDTLDML